MSLCLSVVSYVLFQMHTNLETIVTDFNEARGGDEEDSAQALEGASDIGKASTPHESSHRIQIPWLPFCCRLKRRELS